MEDTNQVDPAQEAREVERREARVAKLFADMEASRRVCAELGIDS